MHAPGGPANCVQWSSTVTGIQAMRDIARCRVVALEFGGTISTDHEDHVIGQKGVVTACVRLVRLVSSASSAVPCPAWVPRPRPGVCSPCGAPVRRGSPAVPPSLPSPADGQLPPQRCHLRSYPSCAARLFQVRKVRRIGADPDWPPAASRPLPLLSLIVPNECVLPSPGPCFRAGRFTVAHTTARHGGQVLGGGLVTSAQTEEAT